MKSFTPEEDVALIRGWAMVQSAEDHQHLRVTANEFWNRVMVNFTEIEGNHNAWNVGSLKTRVGKIRRNVRKYVAILKNIYDHPPPPGPTRNRETYVSFL